jgi:ribosomal-protein-alanine N-acetyltransferase
VDTRESDLRSLRLEPLPFDMLPAIAAIEAAVFPEPLTLPEVLRLWLLPETVYLGFRHGGQLAAYLGFQVHGPTAHVLANATHPDYQGRGLGSRVLVEAEPFARARGARWFLGEVRRSNDRQRGILARLGWRELGVAPRFFGNGEDAVVVWRLFVDAAEENVR